MPDISSRVLVAPIFTWLALRLSSSPPRL
jgi:hypothetical protein